MAVITFLIVFGILSWYTFKYFRSDNCIKEYSWINIQLRCVEKPIIKKTEYKNFKQTLLEKIESYKAEQKVTSVAVYFRDLSNGPIFGINELEEFIPASLLKVPLMMTYFRIAEEKPSLLDDNISYNRDDAELAQTVAPSETLEKRKEYSVMYLIGKLIIDSDNRAFIALKDNLDAVYPQKDLLLETYHEVGVINLGGNLENTLNIKSYASVFRLLYNASYLSKKYSDLALDYLAHSSYKEGLRAGVPANIPMAHKFGERFSEQGKQLHECGIIYFPGNPYLLCVMTKGQDFAQLAGILQDISKAVYEEVNSRLIK